MPGTSGRRRRRAPNRYQRMARRVRSSYRKKTNLGWMVHKFTRACVQTSTLMDTDAFGTLVFQLSDLPNYTDFTNLFEVYMITGVKVTFIWDKNSAHNDTGVINPGDNSFIPNLYVSYDPDSITSPATINDLLERGDCKYKRMDKPLSFFVKPKVNISTYETAVTSGYINGNGWIDTANPGIDYYGLKFGIDGSINGGVGNDPIGKLRIIKKFYFKCKGSQ